MDFPSQPLIPWPAFQMGVLPTGWPPTLAPRGPQVFEGILASSPLAVSGPCCSLHSKAFSPLTVSGKLWVVLVKNGIRGLNSGVWGSPSCYVYCSHRGTPERPPSFVALTVQELHWNPFPAYFWTRIVQFLPFPSELPAFFFSFSYNLLHSVSPQTIHMCSVTRLTDASVTSAVRHPQPVLLGPWGNLTQYTGNGFQPLGAVWPGTVTISPRVLHCSLIRLLDPNVP